MSAISALGENGSKAPVDRLVTLPQFPVGEIPTLGFEMVRWAEASLIQPNGTRSGEPFRFTSDQVNFYLWAYALDDEARWLFNHLARRLAKSSGKSPFAAVYALGEFLGPCRLERFDDRELGGCIGRVMDMPLVQIAATAESQTSNTMRFVRAFCPKDGQLARDYQIDVGKTQFYRLPEGTLEVITSSAAAAEGAQATAAVGDETELWLPNNGGPDFHSTIVDNLTKTGGRMMETSNAWKPDIGSVAEATWDDWVAQEEGKLQGDQRILYDARVAPGNVDMADPKALRAVLEDIYQFCEWVDVENIISRIYRKSAKPDDSKRKYLNRPTAPSDAWLAEGLWGVLADKTIEVDEKDEVVLFFDGSKSRDATALVACRIEDGHVFVPTQIDGRPTIWEPNPAHTDEDTVPVVEVDLAVAHVFDTHNVVAFFADVQEWASFAKIEWPRRHGDDLLLKAVPTGKQPELIAWDMRSRVFEFTRAAELVAEEVESQEFTHDGNPIVARHVANTRNALNRYGTSVSKESPSSPRKIDAAVCVIGARMVRRLYIAAGPKKKRSGIVALT